MTMNVTTVGNYDVKPLPNGMYSVALNNGNLGAFMTDRKGVEKFLEKYNGSGDKFVSTNTKKPKMSYEEAKSLAALSLLPGGGFWTAINPKYEEAREALAYYEKLSNVETNTTKKPKMSYDEAKSLAALSLLPGGGFWTVINPKYEEAREALAYYEKHSNIA